MFTDSQDESSEPTAAVRAKYGAVTAAVQPNGTAVEIPPALGAPTSFPPRGYQGTAAGRSPSRTQAMDKRRRRSLSQMVRARIRLAQL